MARPLRLYRNTGDGFAEVAKEYGLAGPFGRHNASTSWADFDLDGDMDVLVSGKRARLFRNDGDRFTDITDDALGEDICCLHAAAWGDFDNDGDEDLYLARGFGLKHGKIASNFLFRNDGDGRFTDVTDATDTGTWKNSRDATWFDFDNDGDLEILVVNSDSQLRSAPTFASWLLPVWLPLMTSNTFDHANVLYRNNADGTFTDVTEATGVAGAGSNSGAAVADGDGFLDLALSYGPWALESGPTVLLHNSGNANRWLGLKLEGRVSNRGGIGARVMVRAAGRQQFRQANGGVHGFSQDYAVLHFGLGDAAAAEEVEVRWPSGLTTRVTGLAAGKVHVIRE